MTITDGATTAIDETAAAAASDDLETVRLVNGLSCELPANSPLAKLLHSQRTWIGPDAKERHQILREAKSVAIVGASPNPARSSYFVSTYLQQSADFRLYFVNPNATEILGEPVYKSLADLPEVPDIVDVFRRGSDIPSVIDEVVAIGAKTIWVQLGIWNEEAALLRRAAGTHRGHGPLHQGRARPVQRRAAPARLRHRPDHRAQDAALTVSPGD